MVLNYNDAILLAFVAGRRVVSNDAALDVFNGDQSELDRVRKGMLLKGLITTDKHCNIITTKFTYHILRVNITKNTN